MLATALLAGCAASGGTTSRATAASPTEADAFATPRLREWLTAFAHDSMEGRQAGYDGARRAADYLATEARRLGLEPAGENGGYLQRVPFLRRSHPESARLRLGDSTFAPLHDFVVVDVARNVRSIDDMPVIFGGRGTELVSANEAVGRVVVLIPGPELTMQTLQQLVRGQLAGAAGIVLLNTYNATPQGVATLRRGTITLPPESAPSVPMPLVLALGARASAALGVSEATAKGAALGVAGGDVRLLEEPAPSFNVVATLPGRDPARSGEYVAFGAHLDHTGLRAMPVDHDSLRAFNAVVRPHGLEDFAKQPTDADWPKVRAILDSLRRLRPARLDSINNGADDDGSGSVGVLAIAEAFARGPRPARSLLFVWHTAEELGMVGSRWFTDHPTVPLDRIVAQLNVDMIGRGGAQDVTAGGPGYLQLVGSRRLSTELGELVEQVNAEGRFGLTFDYQYDANGHPQNIYCRSDHQMYARVGVPVVFFTTGVHRDYHMETDEVQYVDFDKLSSTARFVAAVGRRLADRETRVTVDQPLPDPTAACRQ